MPIIEFHLLEGRSPEQKRKLCESVTDTVVSVLGVRREQVRILIHTLTGDDFAIAGVTAAEKKAMESGAHSDGALNGRALESGKNGAGA